MSGKGLLHLCQKRWGEGISTAGAVTTLALGRPLSSMELPRPHRQLFFPCPKLTCTVIRLCRVWLGLGLSSQKFSVTWNLGGGPRPWKYLAKSERERVNCWKKEREG